MAFVELHAGSAFSFLNGASDPEAMAERAAELGYSAMALCDRNGVYGAPRFYKKAKELGLRAIVGAEVLLPAPVGAGEGVVLLAESRVGYKNLCRLLTAAAFGRPKGEPLVTADLLRAHADGLVFASASPAALRALHAFLPKDRLYVELQRHFNRAQERHNRALLDLAGSLGRPLLASNAPRYARAEDKELYDVLCCIRHGVTLDAAGARLEGNRERRLKSPAEVAALFSDLPEAVANASELGERLGFTLADLGYRFPDFPLPPGETNDTWLKRLTWEGARTRFPELDGRVRAQLDKELGVIAKLGLAGYFLTIKDIVDYCRREDILVQGRGSAANSAVCYALSITAVDPIKMDLLFERFLSEERGEWPDIDLDLPSGAQREKVIQHLYRKHGGGHSAMTANVITYRPRSAMRELAKVFGRPPEEADRLARWATHAEQEESYQSAPLTAPQISQTPQITSAKSVESAASLLKFWARMQGLPRHLGQHSGGMVIAGGRLDEIVPLEPASMPGRTVVQWDKDDCADLGLIKVDLLGLGMLNAIEKALPLIREREGVEVDLARLPPDDPAVFAMLNKADTVGLFQVESRAQMASLPRHAPKTFYDVVVQVAIIRPGPIVGGMVRPFFERRQGRAPVVYPHPLLEPVLKRTLGVPLFQEQVLRMAMVMAGFTGGEAEELRRAMGFKRTPERMDKIEKKLRRGMTERGVSSGVQEQVCKLITSFALYGFPESHAASFALIAYASAYLKAHHPAAFYVSLLNAWPMGFYHPATVVKDAQRHGIDARPVDVSLSGADCRWESSSAFRLGLRFVKGLGASAMRAIEAEQEKGPFRDSFELASRTGLREDELETLAYAGALGSLGLSRRAALWQVAQAARHPGPLFEDEPLDAASPLPEMSAKEETVADYRSADLTTGPHVMEHYRKELKSRGVKSAAELLKAKDGAVVRAAGSVIVRQRPATANGFVFLTLEDETGMAQAILSPDLFAACRDVVLASPALIVEGKLQKQEGALSVKASRLWPFDSSPVPSHDWA